MTPDEVHQIGLAQVAEISAQLDTILKAAGYTHGTVGERLAALNASPAQLYPNTDAGRAELIAEPQRRRARTMYAAAAAGLRAPCPTQPLEIRRVPPEIQDGASNGYYRQRVARWLAAGDLLHQPQDHRRLAEIYAALADLSRGRSRPSPADQPRAGVEATCRCCARSASYSAYGEGWALYAEQLADELGGYDGIERAGYLQSFLFRAARLVVDTGLNAKRWSREQAIDYMVATTGFARARVAARGRALLRLDRPGLQLQGRPHRLARARAESARRRSAPKFDIKQFHEVLKDGAMPLTILERRIEERTAEVARGQAATERVA